MSWLLRHKLLTAAIVAGCVYYFVNPAGRFGIVRKGLVVYNRIPVCFFDCFVDTKGGLHLEADLESPSNLAYWLENHLQPLSDESGGTIPLLVGTGFDSVKIVFSRELTGDCRGRGFEPHFYNSREAIERFTALREKGTPAALLLKVK